MNSFDPKTLPDLTSLERQQIWDRLYRGFQKAETTFPVANWQVEGLQIWPILKELILLRATRIFFNRQDELLIEAASPLSAVARSEASNPVKQTMMSRLLGRVKSLAPKDVNMMLPVSKEALLEGFGSSEYVFVGSASTAFVVDQIALQPHFDPAAALLAEQNVENALYLIDAEEINTAPLEGLYHQVEPGKPIFAQSQSLYLDDITINYDDFEGFAQFWDELSAIFPLDTLLDRRILEPVIRRTVSCSRYFLRAFLNSPSLKSVFVYAYYGILGWALSAAARNSGKNLVEIQHGVAGSTHEAYNFSLPKKHTLNTLPTHFFFWSEVEQRVTTQLSPHNSTSINAGQSWYNLEKTIIENSYDLKVLKGQSKELLKQKSKDKALLLKKAGAHKNVVLFALQDQSELGVISEVIAQLPKDWFFWIRLHPATMRNKDLINELSQKYESENVSVTLATQHRLSLLLETTDVVVTRYSSTVLDARAFGVRSLILGHAGEWYFSDFKDDKRLTYCALDVKTIAENLRNIEENPLAPSEDTAHCLDLNDINQIMKQPQK